jgi:hypothetical protein
LKALLQERLSVNHEELDNLPRPHRPLNIRGNAQGMISEDTSIGSEPVPISSVLDCLRCLILNLHIN